MTIGQTLTTERIQKLSVHSDDDTDTLIFSHGISMAVGHDPKDRLEGSGISMEPDRTVGLSMREKYQRCIRSLPHGLAHCPMRDKEQPLYPFLVIEAKKEQDAPGFRSVEVQTAFPIRRFLMIQHDLRTISQGTLHPLVWFLAFQGEEWRVYAATLDERKRVVRLSRFS